MNKNRATEAYLMEAPSSGERAQGSSASAGVRAIDFLGALSLMGDMALGLAAGHGVRATYLGMSIGKALNLPDDEQADLFYACLLTDAGCTAWATQSAAAILGNDIDARRAFFFFTDPTDPRDMLKWLTHYVAAGERVGVRLKRAVQFSVRGRQFMIEGLHNTSETAAHFAYRLDRSARVQEALRFAFERWDGSGLRARRGDAIPVLARITYASIFLEVFHAAGNRAAAIDLARARRGKDLDPAVVDAFLHLAKKESFWQNFESESIWTIVREMEPESPFRFFDVGRLDDAATAFGDFADLKSFYTAGHARRVASRAEAIARAMGLEAESIVAIRRGALLHDIGLVAIPSFILHKPAERLSGAEWEMMRLHPYHAERILSRAPVFAPLCHIVAAHHEQPDGHGYFRGLSESEIPKAARIIGVADRFDELTHEAPGRKPLSIEVAFEVMNREAGIRASQDVLEALQTCLEQPLPEDPAMLREAPVQDMQPRKVWPAGLTDREIDVLRVLAIGANRQEMAKRLSVSQHTVRHHLEHIYAKINVKTRVEATLFAIEHGLLA